MKIGALRMRIAAVVTVLTVNAMVVTLLLPSRLATGADDLDVKTLEQAYQPEIRQLLAALLPRMPLRKTD